MYILSILLMSSGQGSTGLTVRKSILKLYIKNRYFRVIQEQSLSLIIFKNIGDFSAIDFNHSFWIAGNHKWAFNSKGKTVSI